MANLRHFFTEFVSALCAPEKWKLTEKFKSENDKASKIHPSINASSYIALHTDFGYWSDGVSSFFFFNRLQQQFQRMILNIECM